MKQSDKETKVIYMDIESYNRSLVELELLQKEMRDTDRSRKEVHKNGTDVAWDEAEFLEVEKNSDRLASEIRRRKKLLKNVIILDKKNIEDVVEFGDFLRLNICDEFGCDEIIGKLVGEANFDKDKDYVEISGNGLIGSLIYGRKIGERISYIVNDNVCFIEILEKLDYKKEKNNNIKRLKR